MAAREDPIRKSRDEARKLAKSLSEGWRPPPMVVPIQLETAENCYATSPVEIWQMAEGDGSYLHKTRFGLSAVGLGMAAASAVGNSYRKSRAAREAAPRFRPMDSGQLYVTDRRAAIQGKMQWIDLWYSGIRMSDCDGTSVTLHTANNPPIQIHVWPPDYFFVLIRFLASGAIMQVPDDPS